MRTTLARLARFRPTLAAGLALLVLAATVLGAFHRHDPHRGTTDTCAVCSLAATTAVVSSDCALPAPPAAPLARLAPAPSATPNACVVADAQPRAPPTA